MVTLCLARHGETVENVAQILQGHLPGHLTQKGILQAETLREKLLSASDKYEAIVVSDLSRALHTAQIVNQSLHLPLHTTPLLRERNWGSLTGKPICEVQQTVFPNDVESVDEMFQRAHRFLLYIKKEFEGEKVIAIGHGLFNRCVIAAIQGITIRQIPRFQNGEVRCLLLQDFSTSCPTNSPDEISAD